MTKVRATYVIRLTIREPEQAQPEGTPELTNDQLAELVAEAVSIALQVPAKASVERTDQ